MFSFFEGVNVKKNWLVYVNLFYKESKSNKKKRIFLFFVCVCGGGGGGRRWRGQEGVVKWWGGDVK